MCEVTFWFGNAANAWRFMNACDAAGINAQLPWEHETAPLWGVRATFGLGTAVYDLATQFGAGV